MSRSFQKGIIIDNLPSCITREILFNEFKKKKIDGALNFKVTRIDEKQQKKLKEGQQTFVKAFVGFSDLKDAIKARDQLTHTNEFEKFSDGPCTSRVALIFSKNKESSFKLCNYVVTNLPDGITPREFDEAIQKFGVLVSTDIIRGKGFIQFLEEKEAKNFEVECRNKNFLIRDCPIEIQVLKKQEVKKTKTTLYFKEYTQVVPENEQEQAKEQIKAHFEEVLSEVKDEITSTIVSFSKEHKKPYAFVNFKTEEATEKAKTAYQNCENETKFSFVSLPDPDYKRNTSDHFVYLKPLNLDVTEEKLTTVLKQILGEDGVVSVRVKKPTHPQYQDSQYAIVVTKEANKPEFIKKALHSTMTENFNQQFLDLFTKDNKTKNTVCACYPFKRHQTWLKNRLNKSFNYNNNYNHFNPHMQMQRNNFMFQGMPPMHLMSNMFMNMGVIPPHMQNNMPPMFNQQQYQQRRHFSQKPHYNNNHHQNNNNNYRNNSQGGNLRQPHQQGRNFQNRNNQQQQQRRPQQQQQGRGPQQQGRGPAQQQQAPKQQQGQPKKILQPKKVDPIQQLKANLEAFKKQDKKNQIQFLGQLIYPQVVEMAKNKVLVNKIIQMLVDLETFDVEEVIEIMEDRKQLLERIQESEELLQQQQ